MGPMASMMERNEAPGSGKAESILAAAKRTFLESRLRRGQHGHDRARGRCVEGDGLCPFRRQGGIVRRRHRTRVRTLSRKFLGKRTRSPRRPRLPDGFGPSFSRTGAVARRHRFAPHHIGGSHSLSDAWRGFLASWTRTPTCPDRSLLAERGRVRDTGHFTTPGSPPSNSSAWCAAISSYGSCSASRPWLISPASPIAVESAVDTFLRAFARPNAVR